MFTTSRDSEEIRPEPLESPAATGTQDHSWVPAIALFAAISTLVVATARFGFHLSPLDFLTYRYAGQQAFAGDNIYAGNVSGPGLIGQPFTYTPLAALLFRGFGVLDWQSSYFIWSVGSLTGLGLVVHSLFPSVPRGRLPWAAAAFVLTCCTTVVFDNAANGQVNIFLMLLCLFDLHVLPTYGGRRARHLIGVGLGLAAAIKLTPALFIVHLAVTRQWKALGTSVATAGVASGAAFAISPHLSREFFGTAVWNLSDRVRLDHSLGYWGNASLSGAFHAYGNWAALLAPVAVIAFTVGALACARVAHSRGHTLNALLMIGLAAPVASPFAWVHHHVYLVPAVLVLARSAPGPNRRTLGRVGLVWLLLVLGPGSGHWLMNHGGEWLLPLALVLREGPVIASCVGIALLLRSHDQPSMTPRRTPSRAA